MESGIDGHKRERKSKETTVIRKKRQDKSDDKTNYVSVFTALSRFVASFGQNIH